MEFSLLLDKPTATVPTYIFVMATCADGRLKRSIKEQILPAHWSPEFSLPTPVKDKQLAEDYKALERKLTRLKNGLSDLVREAKRDNKPLYKAQVVEAIDQLCGRAKKADTGDFYQAAAAVMQEMEAGLILTPQNKRYTAATMVNYNQCIRALKEYRPALRMAEITLDFYNGFVQHLFNNDLSLSAAGTHIKCLKRILKLSHKKGWHNNLVFAEDEFKTLDEKTDDIYLDEAELKTIFEKTLPNETQRIVRDWFILDCYTGLRISDVKLLSPGNINRNTILIANEKTDTQVEIPIHPYVRQILKRWNGLPPKLSEQEINREIKKIGELCKINETVLYTITKGGKRKDYYFKKFEMISNHTARRSFITNMRESGVPDSIVMKLTGIKKPSTLQRYDKLTPKKAAEVAAQHAFFKG